MDSKNKSFKYSVRLKGGVAAPEQEISERATKSAFSVLSNPEESFLRLHNEGSYSFPFAIIYVKDNRGEK